MTKSSSSDPEYLKLVSRIKHNILERYLAPWAVILGRYHHRLGYFDCFAGSGSFRDEMRQPLPGSPIRALRIAKEYVERNPGRQFILTFVEKNAQTAQRLEKEIQAEGPMPASVKYAVLNENAQDFVERLITALRQQSKQLIPSFFFVDPYGHPITIPIMRQILQFQRTEILVNLMWFRFCMQLHNPQTQQSFDNLFGHPHWRDEDFMQPGCPDKEQAFLDYFVGQVGAKYNLPFRFPYSPEDKMSARDRRTKYYLIHFSNHPRAALLMRDVMWRARGDVEELRFMVSATVKQATLFDSVIELEPDLATLQSKLLERFRGRQLTFMQVQVEALDWEYFVEKHYRSALLQLENTSKVQINRKKSVRGLDDDDIIVFP